MTRTIYTLIQIAVAGCYDRRNERIEEEIRRKANGEVAVNFESKLADTRGRATKTDRCKVEGRQRPPNVAEGLPILYRSKARLLLRQIEEESNSVSV
jgi:hypothetical protein